jgi:hypothetical protein
MRRTITVKGVGKLSAKPDYIVLSMSLKAQDKDYEKTMSLAANQLENLRDAIVNVDFQKDDLKTADFGVEPKYDSGHDKGGNYKRWFIGFECTHQLKLEFDLDMNRLARLFSALAKCLARPEFSIQFTVKDKEAVNVALLQSASQNAKTKADILCSAAGVTLGDLISIDYNWAEIRLYSPTRYVLAENTIMNQSSANIAIEPDNIDVSENVTFIWELISMAME